MDTQRKLALLGEKAVFDLSCSCGMEPARSRGAQGQWIYPAALPHGRRVKMLKVLQDSRCLGDCTYCSQRVGRDTERACFTPDELARVFDQLLGAGLAEALFLSSGLGLDPVAAMDRMLATLELLRGRYRFRGFVHLKVLPGAQRAQVTRAAELAQRLSINLEVPSVAHLAALGSSKDLEGGILRSMGWIAETLQRRGPRILARGHTTQFVVGAAGETDSDILLRVQSLYSGYRLQRAYYSKFQPIPDTPLEGRQPASFMREHRLYQADFLMRAYGFLGQEIPVASDGNLSLDEDPKTVWAKGHPEAFPLEVNRADPAALLRVPGLGPVTVKRILVARRQGTLRFLDDLKTLGAEARRAAPFLLFGGHSGERQLTLGI